eukprot:4747383-Amphidinium_carterae.1
MKQALIPTFLPFQHFVFAAYAFLPMQGFEAGELPLRCTQQQPLEVDRLWLLVCLRQEPEDEAVTPRTEESRRCTTTPPFYRDGTKE